MAVAIAASGTLVPALGDNTIWLAPEDTVATYAAAIDLHQLDGCVVIVRWAVMWPSNSTRGCWYSEPASVAAFTLEGLLTPPVPIARSGGLFMSVESGTVGGTVEWEIFSL